MAGKSSLTASFDALLEENKRAFDALMGHSSAGTKAPAPAARPTTATPPSPETPSESTETASVRWLTAHYGNRWRVEESHRRVTEVEAVVLCRLTLLDGNIKRAHFGRAPLNGRNADGGTNVAGTVDGFHFTLQGAEGRLAGGSSNEAALAAAREDGLKNCIASLST